MIPRRALLAVPCLAAPALAQAEWPRARPIEVIVPYPPGGGVDVVARLLTRHLARVLPGAAFVITNRVGAGGQIGNDAIFAARPDGYTLGAVAPLSFTTNGLDRPVRFRAGDFTYLANMVDDPGALWVRADSPLRSAADLRAAAARAPEAVSVGTAAGHLSDDHFVLLAFEQAAGVSVLHSPYNGTPLVIRDLLSGTVDVAAYNLSEGIALLREGRTRCLGQAATERWQPMAEVPTFREQGLEVVGGSARGMVGPPALPAEITARLVAAFADIFADPGFLRDAAVLEAPLRPLLGDAYRAAVEEEAARLRMLHARMRPAR